MEHPCHQCGAPVEDGVAFCRQCSAPQIRVPSAESAVASTHPSSERSLKERLALPGYLRQSGSIHWSEAFPAAAVGAVIGALIMLTPLGLFGVGMVAAGAIAVVLYCRRISAPAITAGNGAKVGALSGAIGFAIFGVFLGLDVTIFHSGAELREAMTRAVEQAAARAADPQAQSVASWLKSPDGMVLMMGFVLFFTLVIFLILASIGGALGAALMRKRAGIS